MADYSIWSLEYGDIAHFPMGALVYGAYEGTARLPYTYLVVRDSKRVILVDVGHQTEGAQQALAATYGASPCAAPDVVLAEVGLRPDQVDAVIVTHAHFDHFGNTDAFPNATFYLMKSEVDGWLWNISLPQRLQFFTAPLDPGDLVRAVGLAHEGRLVLLDGDVEDLFPGIDVFAAPDTHTHGSLWVQVRSDSSEDRYVIAGDNVYVYENLHGMSGNGVMAPVGTATGSGTKILLAVDQMLRAVSDEEVRIIPMHETRLRDRFPSRVVRTNDAITEIRLAAGVRSLVG